jgi:hypothetical protein
VGISAPAAEVSGKRTLFSGLCPAGGPTIPLKFGRVDAAEKDDCVVDGKLPSGDPESTHKQSPADHLRKVFYRMGLNDQVKEEKCALWPSCSPLPLTHGQGKVDHFLMTKSLSLDGPRLLQCSHAGV